MEKKTVSEPKNKKYQILNQEPKKKQVLIFILKLIIGIGFFIYGYYRFFPTIQPYMQIDFLIYQTIYEKPIDTWYDYGSMYYYSPFFYILFYPFHFMPFKIYIILGLIAYFSGLLFMAYRLDVGFWCVLLFSAALQFWVFAPLGNFDLFLFPILIWTYNSKVSEKVKGFILGICLFKGIIIYILVFFFHHSKNKRHTLFFILIGGFINYFWFLIQPELIIQFITHLSFKEHPRGAEYLLGIQYPWLWAIGLQWFQEYLASKRYRPYSNVYIPSPQ